MDRQTARIARRASFVIIGGIGLLIAPEPTAAALALFLVGWTLRAIIRGYRQTTT